MLREVKNAGYVREGWPPWRRHRFVAGGVAASRGVGRRVYQHAMSLQAAQAVCVMTAPPRRYWWCRDRFWWEDDDLTADDVLALVHERDERRQRQLDRAHAALALGGMPRRRRRPIPVEVRQAVFRRDGGRCVECGSDFDIQYDHVIPVALGGSSTVANLQILCAPCNRQKGAALG
jgi:hypothetical protein